MFTVEDYATDERISDHFRSIVSAERLRGMAAAPVLSQGVPIGILYGARREVGRPSDRALDTLDAVAKAIAPVLAASMGAEKQARLRVSEERQRLAGTLHDDVAQLLFSINSSARRARELERGDLSQRQVMERIQQEAQQAADRLRDVLEALAPSTTLERVPAAAQQDIDAFKERTGIPAYLILRGSMVALCPLAERVLTSCVRQVLFNIEQHANATLVVVTLDYQPDGTRLVVQDDGRGVPQGFDVPVVPSGAHHWGLTSITRHVEQLGGSVSLEAAEDGGARFRAWVPLARGDEASGPPTVGRR
jgi:signal transduction histidine kinase